MDSYMVEKQWEAGKNVYCTVTEPKLNAQCRKKYATRNKNAEQRIPDVRSTQFRERDEEVTRCTLNARVERLGEGDDVEVEGVGERGAIDCEVGVDATSRNA